MNCRICANPMDADTSMLQHYDCTMCFYCKEQVFEPELTKRVSAAEGIHHIRCHESYMRESLKATPVVITQAQLNYYNEMNLLFQENMDVSDMTNQQDAANQMTAFAQKWFGDKTLDEQYVHLLRMEACAVALSILVDRSKAKKVRQEKDIERIHAIKNAPKSEPKAQPQMLWTKEEKAQHKAVAALMKMGMTESEARQSLFGSSPKIN